MSAQLHVIHQHTLLDIPSTLRAIADAIEKGDYGEATDCAVVLDAAMVEVFYCGTGEAAPNAHLLLHAGAAKMMSAVMAEKF